MCSYICFYMDDCFAYLREPCACTSWRGQKRALDPLKKRESRAILATILVLGTETRSSEKAAGTTEIEPSSSSLLNGTFINFKLNKLSVEV